MSPARKLENRLILACARTDPDVPAIQDMLNRDPDWDEIVRKAEAWGIAALVYASLRCEAKCERVPNSVMDRLKHLYRAEAIRSISLRNGLRAILARFSEANIPVIVLKGAALAELVYASPVFRSMRDVDLLVHKHDLDVAHKLLRIPGFEAERFPLVEIHHQIEKHAAPRVPIPAEDFWKRSQIARIASVNTLVFSHEDLILHLVLHVATRLSIGEHFVGYVRSLCDIREICRQYGTGIDWELLAKEAHAYRMEKCLYLSLCLARDLVGAHVPPRAMANLKASLREAPLEDRFVTAIARRVVLSDGQPARPLRTWSRFSTELLCTRRPIEGIKIGCRLAACSCRDCLLQLVPRSTSERFSGLPYSQLSERPCQSQVVDLQSSPTRGARGQRVMPTAGEIAVTYDDSQTDGVGAQLQRIYGLYALSRSLHIKYVHTPLARVGYQGLLPLLAQRTDSDFAVRYNEFFSLPSDDFDLECCERVRVNNLTETEIEQYRQCVSTSGRSILLQASAPYGYTDLHPVAYEALRTVTPYRNYKAVGPIRVCIHLRRGDNSVPGRKDAHARLLPNAYYLRACQSVVDALQRQGVPFVVRLHTEIPTRPYTLHPGMSGLYFQLNKPATIDPAQYALEDFESLPNLETVVNVEPQEVLDDFATADVLILSLSSLGYLGGLLNSHGLVIYAPWWHAPLPDWLVATPDGKVDGTQLESRIASHLQRRQQ